MALYKIADCLHKEGLKMYLHEQEYIYLPLGGAWLRGVTMKKKLDALIEALIALSVKIKDHNRSGYYIKHVPWEKGQGLPFVLLGPSPEKGGKRLRKDRQKIVVVLSGQSWRSCQDHTDKVLAQISYLVDKLIQLQVEEYDIFELPWHKMKPLEIRMAKKKRKVY